MVSCADAYCHDILTAVVIAISLRNCNPQKITVLEIQSKEFIAVRKMDFTDNTEYIINIEYDIEYNINISKY